MPDGALPHEIASYVFTVIFTMIGGFLLVRAILDYPGADPDLRIIALRYIIVGAVLILIGISGLAGVGIGRYDHFYDTHRAPVPALAVLRPIAFVIAIVGLIVVHIMNRRRYKDWD